MPVAKAIIAGSPYLGVYLRASESVAFVPPSTPALLQRDLERILGVAIHPATVASSELLGALLAFNSNGIVVGDPLDLSERARLGSLAPVTELRVRFNALGNNILVNDHGALVHPEFSDDVIHRISTALKVPARRGTLAGLGTVGMAGAVTNRGLVVHPKTTESEAAHAEEVLGVPVHRSTANFGVAIVGACLVANGRGIVTGSATTPVEIVHLQEGFQVLD